MMADLTNQSDKHAVKVAILLRNPLECDGLASLLNSQREFHVVGSDSTFDGFVQLCNRIRPQVAIMDASYPICEGNVFATGATLIGDESVQRILFLDTVSNRAKAQQALNVPGAGYVTRQRSFRHLAAAVLDIVDGHIPLDGFDPKSLRGGGTTVRVQNSTKSMLAQLTARERDVLQFIAEGHSVAECAHLLHVSASTVDNHKTALMRKLGVKKVSQLTLLAVREGLIVP